MPPYEQCCKKNGIIDIILDKNPIENEKPQNPPCRAIFMFAVRFAHAGGQQIRTCLSVSFTVFSGSYAAPPGLKE